MLDGGVVSRVAFDRLITARQGSLDTGILGSLDGGQQRNLAVVVEIHANAQVDLGGARIGIESFVQAEDRIARCHFHRSEDRRGHKDSVE